MEYLVLGPLGAVRDGVAVPLGSSKQRSLLSLLLIHANQVVSTDRIIDELWGDQAVADRQNALWVHVSNLRSALEPDRGKRSEGSVLLTRAPGYRLQVGPEELDAWRFEQLVQEGRALVDTDPAAASVAIGEGLALWRGRAYDDSAYESYAQPEIARLEELRLEAVELRLEADLRRGLAAELVGELMGLVRQHPLRERLTAHLMVALYRAGRQAEALRAFSRLRTRLGEEVGTEPSATLRRLEEKIVVRDPSLELAAPSLGVQTRLAIRGYELREQVGEDDVVARYRGYQPAVGQEVAVTVIRPEVADDPSFIRQFEIEAEKVARLDHPHLVPLYDYWREPHAAYLVAPLSGLPTLDEVAKRGSLDVDRALRILSDVGSALAVAHAAGIVHGSIRPASILVDDDRAYLTDFCILPDSRRSGAGRSSSDPCASPEQRAGRPLTPAADVYGLACVLGHALTGRAADDGYERADGLPVAVAEVIRRSIAFDPRDRPNDAGAFVRALQAAAGGGPPGADTVPLSNPYKGLRAFEEADAVDFFGRERVVERLLARLGDGGTQGRFIVVVGPSGGGKSSVVKAGLLPAVRAGALPGSDGWFVVDITPGRHPYEELEAALLRIAVNPPTSLLEQLTAGEMGIRRTVQRVLPDDRSQLLLVIDQFEELFTQAPTATAMAFLDALTDAVEGSRSQVRVVATLRADFYDRPLAHRGIGELVRRGTEVVTPMSPAELERAIDGPAERVGVRFEPGLVTEIVADVADREGALPLLQYASTELFDHRRGATVELTAYRELGGVSGALVRRAESLFVELSADQQETTRQVLLRLVSLGEGTKDLRRRVLRQELTGLGDPAVDHVVDTFGVHRLLSFDRDPVTRGPTVEIAHEALLTEWSRLRRWIDDGREDVRQQRRLSARAAEWKEAGDDPELLLRGTCLDQLAAWAEGTDLTLGGDERSYLGVSLRHRDEEGAAEERRRAGEARLRRKSRRRARMLIGGGLAFALVASLAGYALAERSQADRLARQQTANADAQKLAAISAREANHDPQLAMLLALQALDMSARSGAAAVPEAVDALHWAIQGAQIPYPQTGLPVEARIGPNGSTGIYRLPLATLVSLARSNLKRTFTAPECSEFQFTPCPPPRGGLAAPAEPGDSPRIPREPTVLAPPTGLKPLLGTKVTVMSQTLIDEGLQAELDRFEERTGIEILYRPGFDSDIERAAAAGQVPDIAFWPQPAALVDHAARGELIDLNAYLDAGEARDRFGDRMVDSMTVGAGYFGVPVQLDLKGLIWYPVPEFEQAGYTVPRTWDELLALTRRMVADGRTPWCIGFEADDASGWPGTDWVEGLVLRTGDVELYDAWVAHDVPFNDAAVQRAMGMFGEIAFGPDFVLGGPDLINRVHFGVAGDAMFSDPPGCWLHYQANFWSTFLPAGAAVGVDTAFFPLPPIEHGGAAPLFGGGEVAGVFADRPEVRAFVRFLLDPDWGTVWAGTPGSKFLSPNRDFDPARCQGPDNEPRTNAVRVELCQTMKELVNEDLWRFDGSDSMPSAIGSVDDSGQRGAFWQGMLDYIDEGPGSGDAILARIEDAWPPSTS